MANVFMHVLVHVTELGQSMLFHVAYASHDQITLDLHGFPHYRRSAAQRGLGARNSSDQTINNEN